jgi:glutamine synthetase
LEMDDVVRDALGSHIFANFMEAKTIEWDVYRSQVHPWELDQYLAIF